MSTQNRWVKKSEREPTPEDLPVWLGASNRKGVCLVYNTICSEYISEHTTHWCSAAADIPAPPRGQSQRDKDEDWLTKWMHCTSVQAINLGNAWHAALAYERAEVGRMLPAIPPIHLRASPGYSVACYNSVEAIRARCGGGK